MNIIFVVTFRYGFKITKYPVVKETAKTYTVANGSAAVNDIDYDTFARQIPKGNNVFTELDEAVNDALAKIDSANRKLQEDINRNRALIDKLNAL